MYDGIKQALSPIQKKSAPLKSATCMIIHNIECLPVLEELDSEPTLAEIKAALDSLASSKAPGKDNIPVEVL